MIDICIRWEVVAEMFFSHLPGSDRMFIPLLLCLGWLSALLTALPTNKPPILSLTSPDISLQLKSQPPTAEMHLY